MTGEMSRDEVTRESFPLHFALADAFKNATVEPFDQYQGPFVAIPCHGRIWLVMCDDYFCRWYSESRHEMSDPFLPDGRTFKIETATEIGEHLIRNGGYAVDDSGNVIETE